MQKIKNRTQPFGLCAIIVVCLLLIGGCATVSERSSTAQVAVDKGQPLVLIHPLGMESYRQVSVGIPPFLMPENVDPVHGERVASLFKDVLLGKRTFPRVVQLRTFYSDQQGAIEAGKEAGLDMVLAGRVNYMLEGTEIGGSKLDVSVRLINVETGNTVWYITQNMDQPWGDVDNSILARAIEALMPAPIKRAGAPVVTNMLAQIAVDVADVMEGSKVVRR